MKDMPKLSEVPVEMLKEYLSDTNGDGVLQPDEFKHMLEMSGFKLSKKRVDELLSLADVNHDGVVEYAEFIPVALAMAEEEVAAGRGLPVGEENLWSKFTRMHFDCRLWWRTY